MKIVTSVTLWNDAVGKRMSVTYSEVDETTGKILADNKRADRVVTDKNVKATIDTMLQHGQELVNAM